MKMKNSLLLILMMALCFMACQKDEHGPLVTSGDTPSAPANVKAESLPGGAKISYTLPPQTNLLYIEASYKNPKGETVVTKSSSFKNFVIIEGFPDTRAYDISLVSVSKADKRSSPVSVSVTPLTPPVDDVFQTLAVRRDYGGINVQFTNTALAEYVLYTMIKDNEGKWKEIDRLYTSAPSRNYWVRGLDSVNYEFGLYFRDKWGNHSDTLNAIIKPIYEEKIEKNWKHYPLPSDVYNSDNAANYIERVWDDRMENPYFYIGNPTPTSVLPQQFTFDVTRSVKLSRMVVYQYGGNYQYTLSNPKKYEIWGTNSTPTANGSYDGWTLLLACESIKPSGMVGGSTPEDKAYANAGEEYVFPENTPPVRYIRFRTLETWGAVNALMLAELTLYGQKN